MKELRSMSGPQNEAFAGGQIPASVPTAFLVVGWFGTLFSIPLFVVGLFVGPHIILAACFHLIAGLFSLRIASGLRHQRVWASRAAVALSLVLISLTAFASFENLRQPADWPGAIVPLAICLLFTAVLVRLGMHMASGTSRER